MLCDDLEGWDGGRGGRLICTVVGQKLTQHCKAIFLQIKNKLKKEKKRIHISIALGSVSGWETKILHSTQPKNK